MLFLETWELRRSDETLVFGNAGVTNRNLQAENLFYETDETRKKFDITLMVSQPTFLDGEHVVQEVREAEENSPSGTGQVRLLPGVVKFSEQLDLTLSNELSVITYGDQRTTKEHRMGTKKNRRDDGDENCKTTFDPRPIERERNLSLPVRRTFHFYSAKCLIIV
ncbi:hypothetical protein RUM44_008459 [Polyplax serrata]|uniref:Uncharacterized protein n=1 Tax=Polyplax serrata TaxID=468196 RepID=A0ABR1BCS9_POLSC